MQVIAALLARIFAGNLALWATMLTAQRAMMAAFMTLVIGAWLSIFGLTTLAAHSMPGWLTTAMVTVMPPGSQALITTIGSVEVAIVSFKAWVGFWSPVVGGGPWNPAGRNNMSA